MTIENFPSDYLDLLTEEARALMFLGTSMSDGSPQVTPVWFDMDGDYFRVNTNEGRLKDRNMKARPRIAFVIQDPNDLYRYVGARGEIIDFTRDGADEHINRLSLKYDGKPWRYRDGQQRIIYRIRTTHIHRD